MKKQNKRKVYVLLIALLCFVSFGLGGFVFYQIYHIENKKPPISEVLSINVRPIRINDIVVKKSYVGFVEAINQVNIVPNISGYLRDILVEPGQIVHKGDLLITIDDASYKAKLDAAIAMVLQATADFDYNKNYYERVQKSGKKAFSVIDIDNAKNNFLQSEANLKNAEANKSLAEVNYNYTQIRAPLSGLVGNFTLTPGDYVAPENTFLLSIVQTDPIRVVFSLTDAEYLDMNNNSSFFKDSVIKLTLTNGKPFKYTGQLKYTDNRLNKSTNSLATYVYFENKENELLPNSFVTVDIYKNFKNSVFIDKNLVKMKKNGNFLTIARDTKIVQIPIHILAEKDNGYVIDNSFEKGDLIILDDILQIPEKAKFQFQIHKS